MIDNIIHKSMLKKTLIIPIALLLFFTISPAQAMSFESIVHSAKNLWKKQPTLPDFSLTDTKGNIHTDETSKGKYLLVNFWATWCPPCLKEIPAFVEFYEKHADKLQILGLDFEDANREKIADFSDTFLINYPIILFTEENATQFKNFGEIVGMPTTYIYNPEGKLIDLHMGEMDIKTLEKLIL